MAPDQPPAPGEQRTLPGLPAEVRALVHAADALRNDWAEAAAPHSTTTPRQRDLWRRLHEACDTVWERHSTLPKDTWDEAHDLIRDEINRRFVPNCLTDARAAVDVAAPAVAGALAERDRTIAELRSRLDHATRFHYPSPCGGIVVEHDDRWGTGPWFVRHIGPTETFTEQHDATNHAETLSAREEA
ncbi:hypothetical protein [Nocardiopsis synnemataformans]|uniref:hypothetical protein n=1 Tax=Nocardiopsis synnemataformans TaxID=61305 RepID=UPI003EBD8C9B